MQCGAVATPKRRWKGCWVPTIADAVQVQVLQSVGSKVVHGRDSRWAHTGTEQDYGDYQPQRRRDGVQESQHLLR